MSAAVDQLELSRPAAALVPSYLGFIEEMRALGETIWPSRVPIGGDTPDSFVARLLSRETMPELPAVPESVYWGVIDGSVVGFLALRHRLNERLARFGGHIGYEVRPSRRRQGIATQMLRRVLTTGSARAIGRILVTCSPHNAASRKAIEANGGVLADIVFADEVNRETCRYWIAVRQE